jgi:hypothetical protein
MILTSMARETPHSAQIPGIARIMCRERVPCFLNHLRKTDRCRGLVSGFRPIPLTAGGPGQARRFALCNSQSPPRGGTPTGESPRFCPLFREPCFDARSKAFGARARLRRVSPCPTARLQREEYRLRLKRLPPIRRGERFPSFKSSTAETFGALPLTPLARWSNGNSRFRFGEKNCASLTFSLRNGIQRFQERRVDNRGNGSPETVKTIT